jgi:hypothetical protein
MGCCGLCFPERRMSIQNRFQWKRAKSEPKPEPSEAFFQRAFFIQLIRFLRGKYFTDHPEALEACSERVELGESLNHSCFDKKLSTNGFPECPERSRRTDSHFRQGFGGQAGRTDLFTSLGPSPSLIETVQSRYRSGDV